MGTLLPCVCDAPLYQTACNALASKLRCNGELGKLNLSDTMRNDGTSTYYLAVVERDKNLTTTIDEVLPRISKLFLFSRLHQIAAFQPLAIELGEPLCMLYSKRLDLDVHPDHPRRQSPA